MGDKMAAAEQGTPPQAGESTAITNQAPTPTGRRHFFGRAGILATTTLAIAVALGARSGVAATRHVSGSPQPQRTEQPSVPTTQGEQLIPVPVPPQDCDVPWVPNQPQNGTDVTLTSMRKPVPEATPGGPECWEIPNNTTPSTTGADSQPATPQAKPTTGPQQA